MGWVCGTGSFFLNESREKGEGGDTRKGRWKGGRWEKRKEGRGDGKREDGKTVKKDTPKWMINIRQ